MASSVGAMTHQARASPGFMAHLRMVARPIDAPPTVPFNSAAYGPFVPIPPARKRSPPVLCGNPGRRREWESVGARLGRQLSGPRRRSQYSWFDPSSSVCSVGRRWRPHSSRCLRRSFTPAKAQKPWSVPLALNHRTRRSMLPAVGDAHKALRRETRCGVPAAEPRTSTPAPGA